MVVLYAEAVRLDFPRVTEKAMQPLLGFQEETLCI